MTTPAGITHEQFCHDVRAAAVAWVSARGTITEAEASRLMAAKLVYGVGSGAYRGVCQYRAWANGHGSVEVVDVITASGEECLVQVAGTTLHAVSHCSADPGRGRAAHRRLGR